MNNEELMKNATCGYCNQPISNSPIPAFFKIQITGHQIDVPILEQVQSAPEFILPGGTVKMGDADQQVTEVFTEIEQVCCWSCWEDRGQVIVPPVEEMEAAMFTRLVKAGEKNPKDEATYKGYVRPKFISKEGSNFDGIEFPECEEDYVDAEGKPILVVCIAAIDGDGIVRGVMELTEGELVAGNEPAILH